MASTARPRFFAITSRPANTAVGPLMPKACRICSREREEIATTAGLAITLTAGRSPQPRTIRAWYSLGTISASAEPSARSRAKRSASIVGSLDASA